jgi:hypothetical protein
VFRCVECRFGQLLQTEWHRAIRNHPQIERLKVNGKLGPDPRLRIMPCE